MELLLIYFFTKKIKERTVKFEYNSTPFIIVAVALWLIGEVGGFFIGLKIFSSGLYGYLLAICGSTLGALLAYQWIKSLPKRNIDYYDLRQTKKFLEEVATDAKKEKKNSPKASLRVKNGSGSESTTFFKAFRTQNTGSDTIPPAVPPGSTPPVTPIMEEKQTPNMKSVPVLSPEREPEPVSVPVPASAPVLTPVPASAPVLTPVPASAPVLTPVPASAPVSTPLPVQQPLSENLPRRRREPVNPELKFPESELYSLDKLISAEYGPQTVQDRFYSEHEWFDGFNFKYTNKEVRASLIALAKALEATIDDGLPWLLYGRLYNEVYQDYDKALQFCLTGAWRCNSYKSALLTEAAEILMLGKEDLPGGFRLFCQAILAITEASKAWGDPELAGSLTQERAFHFIRIYLSVYNFTDYRLYLERNVRFQTGLDQSVIERVLKVFNGSAAAEETVKLIPQWFPLIIEKLQTLA
jgi:hypothetical protein